MPRTRRASTSSGSERSSIAHAETLQRAVRTSACGSARPQPCALEAAQSAARCEHAVAVNRNVKAGPACLELNQMCWNT